MQTLLKNLRQQNTLPEEACTNIGRLLNSGADPDSAFRQGSGLAEKDLLAALGREFALPQVNLDEQAPTREYLADFPAKLLLQHEILPLGDQNGFCLVATSKVFDQGAMDEFRVLTGRAAQAVLAPADDIRRYLKSLLGVGADTLQTLASEAEEGVQVVNHDDDDEVDLADGAADASIIRFVNQVLAEAIERRATDVHFEPFEDALRVRYRVDGVLQEANIPGEIRKFQLAIVSRLKILSRLDIAEKRLPQDGRIKLKVAGREVDVRVSVIPMLHGEAVVLRLLDRGATLLGLEYLGMSERDEKVFDKILNLPHGIILVTGPTGSGKTTTLYAGLSRINDIERKIITIEDPIEYHLHGINQIQVSTKAGLTFARGLRSILRHDPDVVLIGEIRDRETAEIAVQASLTGHLVFSTLHTNDAPGAITRLVDMGIEPYLVSSSLEMVVAQRLVRLICKECKETYAPDGVDLRHEFGDNAPKKLYRGKGCRNCLGTGYRGRLGIFEMMPVTEELRGMILERVSAGQLRQTAARQGMRSLREDGWRLIGTGRTTIEEVLRATKEDRFNGNGNGNGKTAEESAKGEGAPTQSKVAAGD